jgi:endoglucanase
MKKLFPVFISLLISLQAFSQQFIHRNGNKIFLNSNEIHLRGACFGNRVWENDVLPFDTHTEADFRRVNDMGMNAVRFYMNYLTFEDDNNPYVYKQAGWNYLDSNIVWAKRHNIYLILNIHVPQGGFQSNCQGGALWSNPANQKRLTSLWKNISEHCKNEPQVAGYDMLNEPIPTDSIAQWYHLAERIKDTIRTSDINHLIIAENAIALNCNYSYEDANGNFPPLTESNLMYTSHIYEPYYYTTQNQSWAGTGDGGKYPDETILNPPADLTWKIGQYNNPQLPVGSSNWKFYKGVPFTVTDTTLIVGRPVFNGNSLGGGIAYFDSITVSEVDNTGNIIRIISSYNLTGTGSMWYWSNNNDGSMNNASIGKGDNASISMTGSTSYANVTDPIHSFVVQKGKNYIVSGWMKGDNIPSGANAYLGFGLYNSPSNSPVLTRDKNFLKAMVINYTQYPRNNNFPVYFGEFGVVRDCFQNGKGGDIWVDDMIHIFDSLGFNWTYHDYREDGFGIYQGVSGLVDTTTGTISLINVFRDYFGLPSIPVTGIIPGLSLDMKIFPNPSTDYFELSFPKLIDLLEISITDLAGREVWKGTFNGLQEIKFGESLISGMYLLRVKTDNGYFISKIVKFI